MIGLAAFDRIPSSRSAVGGRVRHAAPLVLVDLGGAAVRHTTAGAGSRGAPGASRPARRPGVPRHRR